MWILKQLEFFFGIGVFKTIYYFEYFYDFQNHGTFVTYCFPSDNLYLNSCNVCASGAYVHLDIVECFNH